MEDNHSVKKYAPLPQPLTPLVGREEDIIHVCRLFRETNVRLLTFIGPGGVGKTRLALQVASTLRDDFSERILFVSLAALRDPLLVLPTIALELGLSIADNQSAIEHIQAFLRSQRFLLVLDNFEHIIGAASQIESLLIACPTLQILITSRTVLRVAGEQEFPVLPLTQPDLTQLSEEDHLLNYSAVQLFIQRVQAVLPTFQLTRENALTIATICVRLDGLPLAIELAAALIKLLPPQILLQRLSNRLQILTRGIPTLPERQQTMQRTLQWSYDLLSSDEQWLFRLLAVFVDGWTLEAVESIVQSQSSRTLEVINTMASLLDHSLLQQKNQEKGVPRLSMLEIIREYGWECLVASQETEACQRSHALYYLALTEESASRRRESGSQIQWLERLTAEQGNLRAALNFFIERKEAEPAIRLSAALQWYWITRGSFNEGQTFLKEALALPTAGTRTRALARALSVAGELALRQGTYALACSLQGESIAIYQQLEDKQGLAEAQLYLGLVYAYQHQFSMARSLIESGAALGKAIGDTWLQEHALDSLARLAWKKGDMQEAQALCEEAIKASLRSGEIRGQISPYKILASIALIQGNYKQAENWVEKFLPLAKTIGDQESQFTAFFLLGDTAKSLGDAMQAWRFYEQSLAISQVTGNQRNKSMALSRFGDLFYQQEKYEEAAAAYQESIVLTHAFEDFAIIGWSLLGLARIARVKKQFQLAATLLGAGKAQLDPALDLNPSERQTYEHDRVVLQTYLGQETFRRAHEAGEKMNFEQVLTLLTTEPDTQSLASPKYPDNLTEREIEILVLVAQDLTDAQVAERLIISPRTVQGHLRSIYNKIDVSSRGAATRYAIEHKLI